MDIIYWTTVRIVQKHTIVCFLIFKLFYSRFQWHLSGNCQKYDFWILKLFWGTKIIADCVYFYMVHMLYIHLRSCWLTHCLEHDFSTYWLFYPNSICKKNEKKNNLNFWFGIYCTVHLSNKMEKKKVIAQSSL